MIVQEIIDFVKDRSGEQDSATLLREIRNELRRIWYSQDVEGSLQELDFVPDDNKVVTLPWFVFQVKGARRASGTQQRLMTPRAYYQDFNYRQALNTFRVLGRKALYTTLTNPGVLTFKTRAANDAEFKIHVRGPDDFGVSSDETLVFSPGDREKSTTGSYVDVQTLGKSTPTAVDVEVYDVADERVSIIPASQTEVQCIVLQVTDKCNTGTITAGNVFTILFKTHPPLITSAEDQVSDDLGIVLQAKVAGARLGIRQNPESAKLAAEYKKEGAGYQISTTVQNDNAKDRRIETRPSPWTTLYLGHI